MPLALASALALALAVKAVDGMRSSERTAAANDDDDDDGIDDDEDDDKVTAFARETPAPAGSTSRDKHHVENDRPDDEGAAADLRGRPRLATGAFGAAEAPPAPETAPALATASVPTAASETGTEAATPAAWTWF